MTTTDMLRADAASNNRFLSREGMAKREWVERSIDRFRMTVQSWPHDERVSAWSAFYEAAKRELPEMLMPPPVDEETWPDADPGDAAFEPIKVASLQEEFTDDF